MNTNTINDAFEFLRMDGSTSATLIDCMNAFSEGKHELEAYFSKWLWHSEDFEFTDEADLAYSLELGRIEEWLCERGLIYND